MSTADSDRGFIEWAPTAKKTRQLAEHILSIVHFYRDGGHPPPTGRDIYYDLLGWYGGEYGYTKGTSFQRAVEYLLKKMRRTTDSRWRVHFWEITDDSVTEEDPGGYSSPEDFWETVGHMGEHYKRKLSENQSKRVLVFTEGAGAVSQFYQVAKDYGVPVASPGGWDKLNIKYQVASDALDAYRKSRRPTVVLHAGDFDPDGVGMLPVFEEDVHTFIHQLRRWIPGVEPHEVITFKRVMLHPHQIPENKRTPFDPSKVKDKNHRGKKWPHHFKAELQAMSLRDRLQVMREAIEEEIDLEQLERDKARAEEEKREILEKLETLE